MQDNTRAPQEPPEPNADRHKKAGGKKPKKGLVFLIVVIAIVLGLIGYNFYKDTYWPARKWVTYQAQDGSFKYPSSWNTNFCKIGKIFTLPGFVKTEYMEQSKHKLVTEGYTKNSCENDKVVLTGKKWKECSTARHGEDHVAKFSNGAFIGLSTDKGKVYRIFVHSEECTQYVLYFTFASYEYPDGPPDEDRYKYDSPSVDKESFLKSAQYKDIVKFAESIKLKQ